MKFVPAVALSVLLFASLPLSVNAEAAEITVSAAASLTNAFTEMKAAFEKTHPGVTVQTNFAASNPLLQQMREGAPVDVFASADQDTMNKAEADKLIDPATRRNFAANSLVMIVPAGGPADGGIAGLAGLSKAGRIAVGSPDSVPAGRYARAALQTAGMWDSLSPKFVMGESVRQVLDYVSRGEVDAGFVYATDALIAGDKVRVVATMTGHEPVLYPIALSVKADKAAAGAFVDFVSSDEGMAILKKYGFSPAQ